MGNQVIFVNESNGKEVAHNPSTLTVDLSHSKPKAQGGKAPGREVRLCFGLCLYMMRYSTLCY